MGEDALRLTAASRVGKLKSGKRGGAHQGLLQSDNVYAKGRDHCRGVWY